MNNQIIPFTKMFKCDTASKSLLDFIRNFVNIKEKHLMVNIHQSARKAHGLGEISTIWLLGYEHNLADGFTELKAN